MLSWWTKSTSKELKKKGSKDEILDTLHTLKVKSIPEENVKSKFSCYNVLPRTIKKDSEHEIDSSLPRSTYLSHSQSFADWLQRQALPLPSVPCQTECDSSPNQNSQNGPGKLFPRLPLPSPDQVPNKQDLEDENVNVISAMGSNGRSKVSIDSTDANLDNGLINENCKKSATTVINVPSLESFGGLRAPHAVQSTKLGRNSNQDISKPGTEEHAQLKTEANGPLASAPSHEQFHTNVSCIDGHNSGPDGLVSPEHSPVRSPRVTTIPSLITQSRAASPLHLLSGGTGMEPPTNWPVENKHAGHRLPLPPTCISSHSSYVISPSSSSTSSTITPSPGRADNLPTQVSCWKKGKLLGTGTFGHVYAGLNNETGKMCAMKEVTLFSDDPKSKESVEQLSQEITMLSSLRHKNIVQYYGSEMIDNKLCIYLEYVSGGSIHKLLQEYGQFGEPVIRGYTRQILEGLAYLHSKSTVHRDIKGANILVDPRDRCTFLSLVVQRKSILDGSRGYY
eukprot:TRINITY_DN754_c0_g2_i2.p1 TRINITY_DN754_c0_g2~~TRINITY_DN754_c0_g2_i2.p1  ORF type:complete len:508 (-),score=102.82 TRINITY_DN754_c0_g2_i2:1648-3171(-)